MTDKMKPSGIAWIGDVPRSWKCKKLKYLISEPLQYGANEEGCDFEETYPRYIRITDIEDNNQLKSDGKQSLLPSVAVPYILNDGDVLFARSGATVGKTFIYSSEVGCAAFAGYLIRASVDKKQILPKYLYYCTINGGYDNWKNSVFTQATIQNIGADKYAQFSIAFPSITEQQCIADFLDIQCAKIDSVIADIEKQIETLQKYKKSLITEAVTKGLKPDVPMRTSKIEYVSSVPDHWEEKRLNIVAYVRARLGWRGLTADEYVDEGYAFLSAFNIVDDKLDLSEELLNYITKFRYDESPEIKLHSGDVLLVKDGAGLGKCARIDDLPFETAPNGSLAVITPNEQLHYRYLYYFFVGDVFQQRINQIKNGMGVPHLPQGDLRKIVVPIPPMDEQIAISDYLDERCAIVDPLLEEKEKQLETMKQHKKSLIYEYVTGKKRVTEVN